MSTAVFLPPELETLEGIHIRHSVVEVEGVTDEGLVDAKIAAYEHEIELMEGLREVFSRGAFSGAVGNPSRVKVTDQGHQRAIVGGAIELRDEPDGLYGQLRIDPTTAGKDLLILLRSGSLSDLSVEFRPQMKHWKRIAQPGGGMLWRHDKATLVGVSPVGAGAYGEEARVLAVREAAKANAAEAAIARLSLLTSGPQRA